MIDWERLSFLSFSPSHSCDGQRIIRDHGISLSLSRSFLDSPFSSPFAFSPISLLLYLSLALTPAVTPTTMSTTTTEATVGASLTVVLQSSRSWPCILHSQPSMQVTNPTFSTFTYVITPQGYLCHAPKQSPPTKPLLSR